MEHSKPSVRWRYPIAFLLAIPCNLQVQSTNAWTVGHNKRLELIQLADLFGFLEKHSSENSKEYINKMNKKEVKPYLSKEKSTNLISVSQPLWNFQVWGFRAFLSGRVLAFSRFCRNFSSTSSFTIVFFNVISCWTNFKIWCMKNLSKNINSSYFRATIWVMVESDRYLLNHLNDFEILVQSSLWFGTTGRTGPTATFFCIKKFLIRVCFVGSLIKLPVVFENAGTLSFSSISSYVTCKNLVLKSNSI